MNEIKLYKDHIPNPIVEVQFYLREIAKYKPEIPTVYIDGIYNSTTKEAVTVFQNIYCLPPTGTVDLNTWNAIVSEYSKYYAITCEPNKVACFPSSTINIKLGDDDDVVYIIQYLLKNLNKKYKNYIAVNMSGTYNQDTFEAIKQFQKLNMLPVTGIVDKITWNSLATINDTCRLHEI